MGSVVSASDIRGHGPGPSASLTGGWSAFALFVGLLVSGTAPAAGLVPVDPMYVLLFGGAPAAGQGALDRGPPATRHRWQLATHSLNSFVDGAAPDAAGDDLAFRPRYVAAQGTAATVAATDERRPWSADLYAQRTLAGNDVTGVHLIGGIKVGVLGGAALPDGGGDDASLVNTAQVSQGTTGMLVGPMVGIAGDGQLRHHRLRGVFQQSLLYGSAELTRSTVGGDGVDGLRSGVESYVERQDLSVPVSELGLKYQYDLNDRVALGMGAMASVWWDLPNQGAGAGAGGEPAVFLGGMGTLEMKF